MKRSQILMGIRLSAYNSTRDLSDAIFRAAIASCVSDLAPGQVHITKYLDLVFTTNQMRIYYTIVFVVSEALALRGRVSE